MDSGAHSLGSLKNYKAIAKEVKKLVLKHWPNSKVYVFGSVIKGRYTAASDIDILVVLEKNVSKNEEYKVKAEVYKSTEAPIELHITSIEKFEHWYKRFIKEGELVEV